MSQEVNVAQRILKVLRDRGVKPTPFEESKDISRGYLKKAADNGTGVGTEIVEKILLEYPDVDAYWLITGRDIGLIEVKSTEKGTAATNNDEAAVRAELKRQREELRLLKNLATAQGQALLHYTGVEEG